MLHDMKPIWAALLIACVLLGSIAIAHYATKECNSKGGTMKLYGKVMKCEY